MRWFFRFVAALILFQTLFFKFTGAEESVYIFSTLGMEPWGRIGAGASEFVAAILLLLPATTLFGSMMTMGIMAGAILAHLLVLGIEVQGDGGLLFTLGLIVFVSALINYLLSRRSVS